MALKGDGPDLVSFLRARLDEDEAEIDGPVYAPGRARIEVDVKRRIVEDATDVPTISMRHVLRLLALSYADHVEYRDEWKPA